MNHQDFALFARNFLNAFTCRHIEWLHDGNDDSIGEESERGVARRWFGRIPGLLPATVRGSRRARKEQSDFAHVDSRGRCYGRSE
jgi:hypothetical protein